MERLVAFSALNLYFNQYWLFVNWVLKNKLLWNFNEKTPILTQEDAFQNLVCHGKMSDIMFSSQWVQQFVPKRMSKAARNANLWSAASISLSIKMIILYLLTI